MPKSVTFSDGIGLTCRGRIVASACFERTRSIAFLYDRQRNLPDPER
jgi:hypothetical protein